MPTGIDTGRFRPGDRLAARKALGLPAERFRVVKTPIGGSFGGKAEPILEPLCAFFAWALGRPVTVQPTVPPLSRAPWQDTVRGTGPRRGL